MKFVRLPAPRHITTSTRLLWRHAGAVVTLVVGALLFSSPPAGAGSSITPDSGSVVRQDDGVVPAPPPRPAPAPVAAPAPKPAPPARPTSEDWPDASTTGVPEDVPLTRSNAVTVTEPGAVLSGLDITGNVTVQAPDVTIINSRITGKIELYSSGATFRRIEIVGPGRSGANDAAIGWANYSCDGCNVHGWGKAFYMEDNVTITNSWVHDLSVIGDPDDGGSHNEAVYTQGGSNFTIVNNRFDAGDAPNFSAAVAMYGQQRAITDVLVQGNLMNGGGFCLYAGNESGIPPVNARYIGNTFGNSVHARCGQFGAATGYVTGNGNQWTGNVWANGSSVPAPQ